MDPVVLAEARMLAAAEAGLPDGMARRLRGESAAELAADAASLAAAVNPADAKPKSMSDRIRTFDWKGLSARDVPDATDRQSPSATPDLNAWIRESAGR